MTKFEDFASSIAGVVVGSGMKNILGNYDGNDFHADKFKRHDHITFVTVVSQPSANKSA